MTSTLARRRALMALLERGVRGTQAQLCDELARLGHEATQSTISRDLRVLSATRSVDTDGAWIHHLPSRPTSASDRPAGPSPAGLSPPGSTASGSTASASTPPASTAPSSRALDPFVRMIEGIERNEVLIVIRTLAGRAPAVGLELDALHEPEILGTIAGDDTVLVIPRSTTRIDALLNLLRTLTAPPPAPASPPP